MLLGDVETLEIPKTYNVLVPYEKPVN